MSKCVSFPALNLVQAYLALGKEIASRRAATNDEKKVDEKVSENQLGLFVPTPLLPSQRVSHPSLDYGKLCGPLLFHLFSLPLSPSLNLSVSPLPASQSDLFHSLVSSLVSNVDTCPNWPVALKFVLAATHPSLTRSSLTSRATFAVRCRLLIPPSVGPDGSWTIFHKGKGLSSTACPWIRAIEVAVGRAVENKFSWKVHLRDPMIKVDVYISEETKTVQVGLKLRDITNQDMLDCAKEEALAVLSVEDRNNPLQGIQRVMEKKWMPSTSRLEDVAATSSSSSIATDASIIYHILATPLSSLLSSTSSLSSFPLSLVYQQELLFRSLHCFLFRNEMTAMKKVGGDYRNSLVQACAEDDWEAVQFLISVGAKDITVPSSSSAAVVSYSSSSASSPPVTLLSYLCSQNALSHLALVLSQKGLTVSSFHSSLLACLATSQYHALSLVLQRMSRSVGMRYEKELMDAMGKAVQMKEAIGLAMLMDWVKKEWSKDAMKKNGVGGPGEEVGTEKIESRVDLEWVEMAMKNRGWSVIRVLHRAGWATEVEVTKIAERLQIRFDSTAKKTKKTQRTPPFKGLKEQSTQLATSNLDPYARKLVHDHTRILCPIAPMSCSSGIEEKAGIEEKVVTEKAEKSTTSGSPHSSKNDECSLYAQQKEKLSDLIHEALAAMPTILSDKEEDRMNVFEKIRVPSVCVAIMMDYFVP